MLKHLSALPDSDLFSKDITSLIQSLNTLKKNQNYAGWTVVDTDHFDDLFQSGSVGGSCQSVYGNPKLNKCLMAYVADGKNRLIGVKNKQGQLIARCIFRLLWDNIKLQPMLFIERMYPSVTTPEISMAIIQMAKDRAEALGIPLISKELGQGTRYNGVVASLGSNVPYEYCDSSDGVTNGVYTINETHYL